MESKLGNGYRYGDVTVKSLGNGYSDIVRVDKKTNSIPDNMKAVEHVESKSKDIPTADTDYLDKDMIIFLLWKLLDDIDTISDIVKADDKLYRAFVEKKQRERFMVIPETIVDSLYDKYYKNQNTYAEYIVDVLGSVNDDTRHQLRDGLIAVFNKVTNGVKDPVHDPINIRNKK